MAFITLDVDKLKKNFNYLNKIFKSNDIQWSVVSKLLCGNRDYLKVLHDLGIKSFCDSRISNLKMIKQLNPDVETIYIKPPAKRAVASVVKYASISLNTEIDTIRLLSEEAVKQKTVHKIIIMIELGELREGVMGDHFMNFYKQVFQLKNIEVVGIGTNLSCLYGVLPNHDKLIQLCLYEQLIEARFNKHIQFVSGGSSVTIPLIFQKLLPKGINHFRVGETLFLGTDVYNNTPYKKMHSDVFRLYSEIIELGEKPLVPMGEMGLNVEGHEVEFDDKQIGQTSIRAILDLGLLDVDEEHITPVDEQISFVGASSDMLVIDLKENTQNYKVGDLVEFKMDYMGVLRIINSKYIDKRIKQ
ncbi:alanine racemase [Carboxylicivirga taeanensis]|uniref:alanine racemase n=1 Tax=Carboxylicivirga taeanensis TaxID=1416875 RepID=UPI003F6DD0C6